MNPAVLAQPPSRASCAHQRVPRPRGVPGPPEPRGGAVAARCRKPALRPAPDPAGGPVCPSAQPGPRPTEHRQRRYRDRSTQTQSIKQDKPEKIPDLKSLVKEKFTALESMNSDSDLEKNEKYMYFKDQLKDMKKQFRLQSDSNDNDDIEQIDEDIAVTQSQMNFICPITQVEMKKPVRNKVCGHSYEEDAILKIIQTRKQQKKKVRCPKIGCSHDDVKGSDLVPDEALKRAIDSQNKQSWSTL
ncbi:E3 SUMO-protein ligase NSE2 isoform X2 [Gallus gallus]|uniref:E3 SUMO-protein ligase NSE2 isoform X2 n=1 Tax=Gallus gallus TaxID=9031 RepID=UPI001F01B137|nr:E3 SUMO-protein ligase NSE2 isoform X2 [Gallus gallus]